jgi:hypothetical protein
MAMGNLLLIFFPLSIVHQFFTLFPTHRVNEIIKFPSKLPLRVYSD